MTDSSPPTLPLSVPPPVIAEPGWSPVDPFRLEGGRGSFVSGEAQGNLLRVRYFVRDSDGHLVGRAWFGAGAQGPPGHAHGGAIAAVLDEAMGAAAWMAGHLAVAARLDTTFHRMLPLGTDALLEARVERSEGRKVSTVAALLDGSGAPFASAKGLFIELPPERFGPLLAKAAADMGRDPEELLKGSRR